MTLLTRLEPIADEIAARLATCTVAAGAETDIGVKVYRGRRQVDDEMIPCVVLIEGDDKIDEHRVGTSISGEQAYAALAYLACDPENPNAAAHAAIRDMKRALFTTAGKPDFRMGDKVSRLRYLGRDIGPRADGKPFVVAAVEVGVKFGEDLANP